MYLRFVLVVSSASTCVLLSVLGEGGVRNHSPSPSFPFFVLVTPFAPVSFPFPLLARDLPIRWAELGTVYRYERSGTLHGLMRVRGFTQDDAHIFCLPEQLEDEIVSVLDLTEDILSRFGFDR